ncbi:MAG: hypothetical protein ACRDPB_08860, partial [Nocardioidaceae bacterium]
RLKKALWNLYWRGSAPMRERIESELDPEQKKRAARQAELVDPDWVAYEVAEFVTLARSGAYFAGDRRVSRQERTKWRSTFSRHAKDAQAALRVDVDTAAPAVEAMIDLACEMSAVYLFRSEDPVAAARFVVSEHAHLLWSRVREERGFEVFTASAAPQLVRWERSYGWTRFGSGVIAEKETSLAAVLAQMLQVPDAWLGFADGYLDALDSRAPVKHGSGRDLASDLAEWHELLLDRLATYDAWDRLERLAGHQRLTGPEAVFFQARCAHRRGDLDQARRLVGESLERLPGHPQMLAFATEIGAPLPAHAAR